MKPLTLCLLALMLAACSDEAPAPQQAAIQPATARPAAPASIADPQPVAAVAQTSTASPDAVLAAKIKKALDAAAAEISQGIDVTVANGVVRLFGTVGSAAERRAAAKIAASTAGVSSVENRLVIVKGS